jgi:hypothetical protein
MKKRILLFLTAGLMALAGKAQDADPSVNISISPSTLTVGGTGVLDAQLANLSGGTTDIVPNSLEVTISVPNQITITGINFMPANWYVYSNTTGAGNTYKLRNSGTVAVWDIVDALFNVKALTPTTGTSVLAPIYITYISANNPLLGGAPNAVQGNQGTANDNAQVAISVNPTDLPITLTSYTVQNSNCNDALVKWSVADAKNFDHFEVERATDGKSFTKVGTVPFSSAQSSYSYTDANLADGTYQYRLRNVDIDGTAKVETAKSVTIKCANNNSLTVVPTLTRSDFAVRGLLAPALVRVYSAVGQMVIEKQNINAGERISVSGLAAGTYFVQVIQKGAIVKTTEIVKQ